MTLEGVFLPVAGSPFQLQLKKEVFNSNSKINKINIINRAEENKTKNNNLKMSMGSEQSLLNQKILMNNSSNTKKEENQNEEIGNNKTTEALIKSMSIKDATNNNCINTKCETENKNVKKINP